MLTVTTAATDLTLLTIAELRAAVGATDGSQDAALITQNAQGDRDPLLMSKTTEGVASYSWKVDLDKNSVIPAESMTLLHAGGYVNYWVA